MLNLVEEASEVLTLFSKAIKYDQTLNHIEIADEVGDVLACLTKLASNI